MSDAPARPVVVRTFMTHDMKDADISALSTGREDEFRRIMDAIARSRKAAPGPLQHVVLYGARGFGKSFMTRRVQIAVAGLDEARGPVVYVLLPEEQHNLQRSPHAFLDAIAHELVGLEGAGDRACEAALFQWPKPGEEAKRWKDAAARLEDAVDKVIGGKKGLVVAVVENFDGLVETLFKETEDEQRLRAWLDRPKNRVMLLATATGTVDTDYERPLFKAFEPVRLAPWTPADCIAYFDRLRRHQGREPLDADAEAKARAIAEFIGGTPRLAQLLAEILDTREALTVAETMSALADRLAEYYRRRIEDLPPLARGLLDALIRGGEPASQTELAARVGADGQNVIARTMDDLQRADMVRGRPARDSRETLYAVTDRVFVHYYRLRQGSRIAHATPLATILDFLESFYSRDEQRAQALLHLEAGRDDGAWARAAEAIALARKTDHRRLFASAMKEAISAAAYVQHPEVITLYGEWVDAWRAASASENLLDPPLCLKDLFLAAARARAFSELDSVLEAHGQRLAEATEGFCFMRKDGEILARVATAEGRAAAFEAAAGLFPRIAAFMARLPEDKRDSLWLTDLVSGFAAACRDPGLLRDVATLLTADLASQAPASAALLRALAQVDEAPDAETLLARMDPDLATLIRRLRDLPDPPPVPPKRRAARQRERSG